MAQSKAVMKKEEVKKTVNASLSVDVFDLKGKAIEKISLQKEVFASKENPELVSQAVRVYLANKRQGTSSTKTRGEVAGSTRKIYRQKGTGRARHGGVRAPIFVHGGIAFGPKPRDYTLSLSQKMRRAALFSVLTTRLKEQSVKVVSGLESVEPKTKNAALALKSLALAPEKKSVLIVTGGNTDNVVRAARNIQGVSLIKAAQLNAYDALRVNTILFMKESLDEIDKTFLKKN